MAVKFKARENILNFILIKSDIWKVSKFLKSSFGSFKIFSEYTVTERYLKCKRIFIISILLRKNEQIYQLWTSV